MGRGAQQSQDLELQSASSAQSLASCAGALPDGSSDGGQRSAAGAAPASRRRARRRRALLAGLACVLALLTLAYVYLPSWIVQGRLAGADVQLERAQLELGAGTSRVLAPSCRVVAPQSLLRLPLISYRASIQNMRAKVLVDMGSNRREELGLFSGQDSLVIDSSRDLNVTAHGLFDITGEQYFGAFVNKFVTEASVSVKFQAEFDANTRIWGWFPLYVKGISVSYTASMPAMNNLATELTEIRDIFSAEGRPSNLSLGASAWVYNPSRVSLTLNDYVQIQVVYRLGGRDFQVGLLRTAGMTVAPGGNLVRTAFDVLQDGGNREAVEAMMEAYLGGVQDGYGPSGTKPLAVRLRGDGGETSASELVRAALSGLNASVLFRPKPFHWLENLTVDVVVGGSIFGRKPELWSATVNLNMMNPLPAPVRLDRIHLEAYHKNLGGVDLYNFTRTKVDLGDNYWMRPKGRGHQIWQFEVYPFKGEFKVPDSMSTIYDLIREARAENVSVGLNVTVIVTVGTIPGFRQEVVYTNREIFGAICYHVEAPTVPCGMGAAGGAAPRAPGLPAAV